MFFDILKNVSPRSKLVLSTQEHSELPGGICSIGQNYLDEFGKFFLVIFALVLPLDGSKQE